MRFFGLSLADRVPDANSIWPFREALTRAQIGGVPAIEAVFRRFHAMLQAAGYIAMGGQIVDAGPWWRRRSSATPRRRSAR